MTPAVETHDAFRIFESAAGGSVALQGLTLTVEPGEIVVVLGPSGSGKSTLLRVLAGFEQLTAGTARVHGVEIGRLSRSASAAFRARHLGLLDQHYARFLSPDLTCLRSVALQLRILGLPRADAEARARETLERVGLADRAADRPGILSGGEQQRVAVCAAVAHRPRLLLADEPAGELDAENATIVYAMIGEFVRESAGSAVIVSHDTAAAEIADRLVYIRDGRVVEEARPDEPRSLIASHGWVRIPEPLLRQTGHPRGFEVAYEGGEILLRPIAEPPAAEAEVEETQAAAPEGESVVVAAFDGVTRRFGPGAEDDAVLNEVSCSFAAGTFTAVVGRSGSGKTTMLHLLAGLDRPTSGAVTLLGRRIDGLDRAELAELRRLHVALVTQEPGLIPYLTAAENTQLAVALRGRSDDEEALVERVLTAVSLQHRTDTPAAKLSAGERQRLAVARALAAGAELLLVDEPTARLDEENARTVAALLRRAARAHGLAVVCATHDPVVIEAADTILPLRRQLDRVDLLPAV